MKISSRKMAVMFGVGLGLALFEVLTRSECGVALWTSASGLLECASLGAHRMPDLHKSWCTLLGGGLCASGIGFLFSSPARDAEQVPEPSQGKPTPAAPLEREVAVARKLVNDERDEQWS